MRQLCDVAFKCVDLDYRDFVVQDERFFRPAEVDLLVADASKARDTLGWTPDVAFDKRPERADQSFERTWRARAERQVERRSEEPVSREHRHAVPIRDARSG